MGRGTKWASKVVSWLKNKLLGTAKVLYLKADQYLRISGDGAEKVSEDQVDEEHRIERLDRPRFSDKLKRKARIDTLQDMNEYQVARKANDNQLVRSDVLDNPGLVDASSEWEAQLKLDIADGKDISSKIKSNPKISESDVRSELDTAWMARMGDNMTGDIISDLDAALKSGDGEAGSDGTEGGGRPSVSAGDVGNSASGSSSSSGVSTSPGNSAGGHATGPGNSVSAGDIGGSTGGGNGGG